MELFDWTNGDPAAVIPLLLDDMAAHGILQRITLHRVRPHFYAIDPSVQWHITSTLEPRWMAARV